ncbi:MAG: nucleoside-diphosphate sugar epimerase/dehydratase [Candidatus Paceibacterota bacterium]
MKTLLKLGSKYKFFCFLIADSFAIAISVYLAFSVRFEGAISSSYYLSAVRLILINLIICLVVFYFLKLYSFSWTYVSTQDLVAVFKAVVISLLCTVGVFFVFRDMPFFSGFPRSIIFISYFFIFILSGGIRFAKRLYRQIFLFDSINGKKRILIIGAGDAGEQVARGILSSSGSHYITVGFVDDNKSRWGNLIHGIEVLGSIDEVPKIVAKNNIEEIIIALPSAGSKAIRRAVELGRLADIKNIKIVPSIHELIDGNVSPANIRDVEVEDLLERDAVMLDMAAISGFIKNKTILVTGAAGSIGSELCRQIMKFNPKMLLVLDQDETGIFNIEEELKDNYSDFSIVPLIADICDGTKIKHIFEKFRPAVVFHAAAYKHVPLMEEMPDEAVKNNIFGTKAVAAAAMAAGAEKFVMISTDKAVNPTSVMGATKRVCEMVCQNFNAKNATKFISVRFGNVLNSRGSVIPTFREQIRKGGPVEVTDPEMTRYFMLTSEACLLVLQAGAIGSGGEVFVLDMGKPVKILDLAREMIKLSGFEPDKDIPIVFIGRRPGEKLYEELLTAAEGTIATRNQKIYIAKQENTDEGKLNLCLADFGDISGLDRPKIEQLLKELVPSFNHQK